MKKVKEISSLLKGHSILYYSIALSIGVIGFVIFQKVLFLIYGALASVVLLFFKKWNINILEPYLLEVFDEYFFISMLNTINKYIYMK